MEPKISIIIPTFNAYHHLKSCLGSIKKQSYKNLEIIINDDKRTNDRTPDLIKIWQKNKLKIIYIKENKSMAQGRKRGVDFSHGKYLLHLDADMQLTKNLLKECVYLIDNGYDALVIPEESFGTTFWAKCKWLEKKCYNGIEQIESLRFIKRGIYKKLGGHDERMVFSEDKDFDIRTREAGYKIGQTQNVILHNEGNLSLLKTLKKKLFYAETADFFAQAHPKEFRWQTNILIRYKIFLAKIKYLFHYPLLYIGMIFMKTTEFIFGGIGFYYYKNKPFIQKFIILWVIKDIKNFWIIFFDRIIFSRQKIYKLKLRNGLIFNCRSKTADVKEVITTVLISQYPLNVQNGIKKNGTVIDLGAHIGTFSLALSHSRPDLTIFAVEPIKNNFDILSRNIKENYMQHRIHPIQRAVSNFNGIDNFVDYGDTDSYHLADSKKLAKHNAIQVNKLATLINKYHIRNIDLIKLDIEGEEYKVIEDSLSIFKKVNLIILEYHMIINNKIKYPKGNLVLKKLMSKIDFIPYYMTENVACFKKN